MMPSLSSRIHEVNRLKAKRSKYASVGLSMSDTPKLCSCWMCGNPRKWFNEKTIQERKMYQEGAY